MNITELHRTRIKNDYNEMVNLSRSPMVSWVATKGTAPYVEEYLITINVRTYSAPGSTMNQCKVRISLPPQYPQVAPNTIMEGKLVYHPNWYTTGRWCCGKYKMTESLGNYVIRLIQTLQFDPIVTNPKDYANKEAAQWYLANSGLFPSDKQPLPSTRSGFRVIR